jgi:ATP-dependent RNA helicase DOB1
MTPRVRFRFVIICDHLSISNVLTLYHINHKQTEPDFDVRVLSAVLPCLDELSAVRIHMNQDLRPPENRLAVGRSLREVERRLGAAVPLLDPVKDLKITAPAFATLMERGAVLEGKLAAHPIHARADRQALVAAYARKAEVSERARALRREARQHQALVMRDDLKRMKRVLRRLGFVDADNVLQLKGRVACEINTLDELVTTELMFNGVFNDLKPEQLVALLGCMCFEEKKKEGDGKVREDMEGPFGKLKETARAVGKVVQECKIALDPDEYAESFNPDMIEVLYAWTLGAKFAEVIKLSDAFEGCVRGVTSVSFINTGNRL